MTPSTFSPPSNSPHHPTHTTPPQPPLKNTMASLIFAAGAFTYDKVQKSREKKRAAREDRSLRYSELEKDHAEHLARTQSGREICRCEREGWDGKTHRVGCVRARGTMELDEEGDWIDVGDEGHFAVVDQGRAEKRRSEAPPSYESLEVERKGKGGNFGRNARKEDRMVG